MEMEARRKKEEEERKAREEADRKAAVSLPKKMFLFLWISFINNCGSG